MGVIFGVVIGELQAFKLPFGVGAVTLYLTKNGFFDDAIRQFTYTVDDKIPH